MIWSYSGAYWWGSMWLAVRTEVVWGAVACLLVWTCFSLVLYFRDRAQVPSEPLPDEILARRLKRGDIDSKEYASRLAALGLAPEADSRAVPNNYDVADVSITKN